MIMAGATLLGVGSAVYFRGDEVWQKIALEMEEIMREENINSLRKYAAAPIYEGFQFFTD